MNKWKAELRAWLVGIVREAIRVEGELSYRPAIVARPAIKAFTGITKENWDGTLTSYERMESNALKQQESYYEPRVQG